MNNRINDEITDFIFISDKPRKADVILLPGGSDPTIPEKAAELFADGFALFIIPSGGASIKTGKFSVRPTFIAAITQQTALSIRMYC
ncbi:hypothetical protein QBE55_09235 [Eubacteriales bacterium mix99]|jgi:hypothetical protein